MKKSSLAVLIVGLALILGATSLTFVQAQPIPGGRIIVGKPMDAVSLDSNSDTTAAGAIIYGNLIEPLLVMKDGKITPHLATKYEIINPTRVRFSLRKGIQFHDGTPFNAQAVKFTLDRAVKMPARWLPLFGPLKGAEVVDEYTVDVLTEVPYGPILGAMTMIYAGIISPKAVETYGDDYGRHPVGTGPFKFKEWKTKESITLVRNDNYWGKKAYLDEVVYKVIPEPGARMMGMRTGDLDMIIQPNPAELPAFRKDPKFTVAETQGQRIFSVVYNLTQPPVDDARVRHALAMAVNTKGILDNILEGGGVPARSYIAPSIFGFQDMNLEKRYPYDPKKAKALLAEAGWKPGSDGFLYKDGKKLSIRFLGAKNRFLMDAEICEAVQAMWKEIGVDVKLDFFEWAATFNQIRNPVNDYHVMHIGWVLPNPDADVYYYSLFHSSSMLPKGWNFCRFVNSEADKLLDEARSSYDQPKRLANYKRIQEILAQQLPWVPIFNTKEMFVLKSTFKGFVPDPCEYLVPLDTVWVSK